MKVAALTDVNVQPKLGTFKAMQLHLEQLKCTIPRIRKTSAIKGASMFNRALDNPGSIRRYLGRSQKEGICWEHITSSSQRSDSINSMVVIMFDSRKI